jgi:hypothetical protein
VYAHVINEQLVEAADIFRTTAVGQAGAGDPGTGQTKGTRNSRPDP